MVPEVNHQVELALCQRILRSSEQYFFSNSDGLFSECFQVPVVTKTKKCTFKKRKSLELSTDPIIMSLVDDYFNETKEVIENYIKNNFVQEKYGVIAIYIPVFFSALIANMLVIIIVMKDHYMRSATNYFLVNLSIADLLVTLICMPEAAFEAYTSNYNLGRYPCKISSYLNCVLVSSSIFTITSMAVDRYLAISKPLGSFYRCFNKRSTIILIICLWSASITLYFPIYIIVDLHIEPLNIPSADGNLTISFEMCEENWNNFTTIKREKMGWIWFFCTFAIPGAIMIFGYSMMGKTLCSTAPPIDNNGGSYMLQRSRVIRSRKRVACILLLLAFVFGICWLPYHMLLLLFDTHKAENEPIKELRTYLLLLGHSNSAFNPIIYCTLSRRFRNSILKLCKIKMKSPKKRNQMELAVRVPTTRLIINTSSYAE
ncbi:hypothetical protein WA026_004936 [Henosepilachna vigintioctopunctata]|uniref:G-protein coupled receptors family 1 profile domain-containing protein n=1 Tax=Henosepilachna vigintioctopunctata TaxID=420089 RepID=A0AAW1UT83_9CUCU